MFIKWLDKATMEEYFRRADVLAEKCSAYFGGAIVLENEKAYWPLNLMKKKRYIGKMYEMVKGKIEQTKLDAKGVELVRRDICGLAKKIYKRSMTTLMHECDATRALEEVRSALGDLVHDRVPYEDYWLSKQMKSEYASMDLAQVQANEELKRLGREAARVGDRQPYVFVITPGATKASQKAKDPSLALEQNCKVDRLYYLTNQVSNPLLGLFENFGAQVQGILDAAAESIQAAPEWQRAHGQSTLTRFLAAPAADVVDETEGVGESRPAKRKMDLRSLLPPSKPKKRGGR